MATEKPRTSSKGVRLKVTNYCAGKQRPKQEYIKFSTGTADSVQHLSACASSSTPAAVESASVPAPEDITDNVVVSKYQQAKCIEVDQWRGM